MTMRTPMRLRAGGPADGRGAACVDRRRAGRVRVVHPGRRRSAALLLEVVIALAVLTTAMGFLCAQLATGLNMTTFSEDQMEAAFLSDRILAQIELDPNLAIRIDELAEEEVLEDSFGDAYPGYFWRMWLRPVEEGRDDLSVLRIDVLYQSDYEYRDVIDGARVVRRLGMLRAAPARFDLIEDGGIPEEMVDELAANVPIPGFDPRSVDLHALASLDAELVMQFLPMIMQIIQQQGLGSLQGLAEQGLGGGAPFGGRRGTLTEEEEQRLREALEANLGGPRPPGGRGPRQGGSAPGGEIPMGPEGPVFEPGGGSGPDGRYTIEDLMRIREELRRQHEQNQQRGGRGRGAGAGGGGGRR